MNTPSTSGRPAASRVPAAAAAAGRPALGRPAPAPVSTRRGRASAPVRSAPRALAAHYYPGATSASWAPSPSRVPGSDPPLWDCVGMGEALVDCCAAVGDDFLAEFGVAKGGRR